MELFTPGHLLVMLIVVAVLFFGWKQLPDMARSLGRSLRIFKTEIKGMSEDDKAREAAKADPPAIAAPPAEIVKNDVAKAKPRPAPSPNGRAVAANTDTPAAGGQ
jgi:sec-independent protein translocase protein TatA